MKYVVKKIEENIFNSSKEALWKYIVSKKDDTYTFVAGALKHGESPPFHNDIAKKYSLLEDTLIGGGKMNYYKESEKLEMYGSSTVFGPVPKKIVENFKEEIMKKFQYNIKEINIR